MVNVAQSVEHQIVALVAVGSIPTIHPIPQIIKKKGRVMVFSHHFFMVILVIINININAANSPVVRRLRRPAKSKISSNAFKIPTKKSKYGRLNQKFLVAARSHGFVASFKMQAIADKKNTDNQGKTEIITADIILALENQDDEKVKKILSEIEDINGTWGQRQETILHKTVLLGNRTLLRKLLAMKNIDVNVRNFLGYTPLHMAVLKHATDSSTDLKYSRIFDLLVENDKIHIDAQDKTGRTPLHIALDIPWREMVF